MPDLFKNQFATLSTGDSYGDNAEDSRLNTYFSRYDHGPVQTLHDSLTAEAIQFGGVECIYLRREMQNADPVFGEDPTNKFSQAFAVSVYIENFDSWAGERDFFSKFGYVANDELTVSINSTLFKSQVDGAEPSEGDLVYFPMGNTLLEITFVEDEDDFYIHGKLPTRQLTMQKFQYSGEEITDQYDSTGDGTADTLIAELTNLNDLNLDNSPEQTTTDAEQDDFLSPTWEDPFENGDF